FCDFMFTSMDISILLVFGNIEDGDVYVGTKENLPSVNLKNACSYKGFCVNVTDKITVCGFDDRGAAQGLYFLEEIMTEKKAPFVEKKETRRKPLFSPRMVHSGFSLDDYPNEHLAKIARSGRDAILIFTKDINVTPAGYLDFNGLIKRSAKYGIDVYAYSYFKTPVHPDDDNAKEVYDSMYGKLFRECPGLKGVVLVGESVEFASKDPRVCEPFCPGSVKDPTGLPGGCRPGWFPCNDFPQWLCLVRDTVRKEKPDADIVFWTYNWGWAPEKERIELINNLPTDISLLVTYEMFEQYKLGNIVEQVSDYSLVFEGPGKYFTSEANAAKKRGIRLYAMSNTGGMTWDMGTIPYEPMPYQWIKRFNGLLDSHERQGLCGLMECHHYGFYPSFIGDLSNLALSDTELTTEEALNFVLSKYYSNENAEPIKSALKLWSEAITYFTPCNEDQYGPFRIGPAYPLFLNRVAKIPAMPYATGIYCYPEYPGFPGNDKPYNTVGFIRIPEEIPFLEKARALMNEGVAILESIESKNNEQLKLINLGKYISNYLTTGINVKKWYTLKCRLRTEKDKEVISGIFNEFLKIAENELENAQKTIPLLEADSRLGWEPKMEYLGGKENVEWKIMQLKYTISTDIPNYRKCFEN
ncbi:MAG: hypothetical protein IJN39_02620, partial [Clostridia bacterium]|nr:hypothetical protein [Clostridia bacterium]